MKDFFHAIFAAAIGALAAYFNVLLIPLIVLLVVMLIDYITGMAGAAYSGKLNSRVGAVGILKKAGYIALVAVGIVADYLISNALLKIGIDLKINYCFGMIITIWLIINELISILENLGELDVPLPAFLVNIIKTLKNKVEEQAEAKHIEEEKENDNNEPGE